MNATECIKGRRSIRKYKNEKMAKFLRLKRRGNKEPAYKK